MKYFICLGLLSAVVAYPGIIHDEPHSGGQQEYQPISESGHHHQVEHQHAKSHQSIKFEHYHPVPVYVKKEHAHLLKHPIEKGKSESNLKLVHPKTEHSHGDGLVLEDERHNSDHHAALEHGEFQHGGFDNGGYDQGLHGGYEDLSGGGYQGYGGGEEVKGWADLAQQPEAEGHHFAEAGQTFSDAGEGHQYESY